MKHWPIIACATALFIIGCQPTLRHSTVDSSQIGDDVTILGKLGLPVGQQTTITGIKKSVGPIRDMFTIETIDGTPSPAGLRIRVHGIANWPDETRATLRGSETGVLDFLYLHQTNYSGPDDDRWTGPHQHLFLHFDVSEVVSPTDMKIVPTK